MQTVSASLVALPEIMGSVDVMVVGGIPTAFTKVSGDNQTSACGSVLPAPFVANAADLYGNPCAGRQVLFTVMPQGPPTVTDGGSLLHARSNSQAVVVAVVEEYTVERDGQTYIEQRSKPYIYTLGGVNGTVEATIEKYDPETKTSIVVGSMTAPRYDFTLTELGSVDMAGTRFLITGGVDPASGAPLNSAEIFETTTNTSILVAPMVRARYGHTATLLPDGAVLICGGCDDPSAEIFDPATNAFSEVPVAMYAPRRHHTATLAEYTVVDPVTGAGTRVQKILLAGGAGDSSAELFDCAAYAFTKTQGNMLHPRRNHTATLISSKLQSRVELPSQSSYPRVLLVGGENGAIHGDAEFYKPETDSFESAGELVAPRARHCVVSWRYGIIQDTAPNPKALAQGDCLMFIGGVTPDAGGGIAATDSVEIFKLPGGPFESIPAKLSSARYGHCAVLLKELRATHQGPLQYLQGGDVCVLGGRSIGATGVVPLAAIEIIEAGEQLVQGTFAGQSSVSVETDGLGNATAPAYGLSAVEGTNLVQAALVGFDPGADLFFTATGVYVPGAVTTFRITLPGGGEAKGIYAEVDTDLTVEVTALDAWGVVVTDFTGDVRMTTSAPGTTTFDEQLVTFTAAGQGKALVTGRILAYPPTGQRTAVDKLGGFTLTASSVTNPTVRGTVSIRIHGPVKSFSVHGPDKVTVGATFAVSATAMDERNNLVYNYVGPANITTSMPGSTDLDGMQMTFVNGSGSLSATALAALPEGQSLTITLQDNQDPTATGSCSMSITSPIQPTRLALIPSWQEYEVGQPIVLTVRAEDDMGNVAVGWTSDIVLTTSEPGCIPEFDNRAYSMRVEDQGSISIIGALLKVPMQGIITVTAQSVGDPGLTGTGTYSVIYYRPGLPTTINTMSGNNQNAPVGSNLPEPFVVRVTDARGIPVAGTQVRFSSPDTGGSFSAAVDVLHHPRSEFAMVEIPDEYTAFLFGGANGGIDGTIEKWAVTQYTSEVVGQMLAPRYNHTATLLHDGTILIVGGLNPVTGETVPGAELFDPHTYASYSASDQPLEARWGHTATLLSDGRVLIAGGSNGVPRSTMEIYDPATDTFTAAHSMSVARTGHTATPFMASDGFEKVFITGGAADRTAEIFDPMTNTVSFAGQMSTTRFGHTASYLASQNKILIAGGGNGSVTSSCEMYDVVAGTFSAAGDMAAPRMFHTATVVRNGDMVVLAGGLKQITQEGIEATGTADVFFCATGVFSLSQNLMTKPRFHHAAFASMQGDKVWLVGGKTVRAYPPEAIALGSCEEFYAYGIGEVAGSFGGQAFAMATTDAEGLATSPVFTVASSQGWNTVQALVVAGHVAPANFSVFGYAGRPPGQATQFAVWVDESEATGWQAFQVGDQLVVHMTAFDDYWWVCQNFSGTVRLSTWEPGVSNLDGQEIFFDGTEGGTKSISGQALALPTYGPPNNGVLLINAVLATDETVRGSTTIVIFGPPASLEITAYPQSAQVGSHVYLQAWLRDSNGTQVYNYTGAAQLTTSCPGASDLDGRELFFSFGSTDPVVGMMLSQPPDGVLGITATLNDNPSVQGAVQVGVESVPMPGEIASFELTTPSTQMQVGQTIELTIRARDAHNATVTDFDGVAGILANPAGVVAEFSEVAVDFMPYHAGIVTLVGTIGAVPPEGTLTIEAR
ncbi:MAG: hypothetical protein RDV41_10165, partial [Planctomycetota bacterium]|nr:hypothetical protein [Planctomycetota bacterium]